MKRLCKIEETIQLVNERGVLLLPMIKYSVLHGMLIPDEVILRFENGNEEKRKAEISIPRQANGTVDFLCRLKSSRKELIPPGTELWADLKETKNKEQS